jgi:hypothetical protein
MTPDSGLIPRPFSGRKQLVGVAALFFCIFLSGIQSAIKLSERLTASPEDKEADMRKTIKEPVTHDYAVYSLLTGLLAIAVLAAHFFNVELGLWEVRVSEILAQFQFTHNWAVIGACIAMTVLVSVLILRQRRK